MESKNMDEIAVLNKNNKEITEKDVISLLTYYGLPTNIFNMTLFKRAFIHSSYIKKENIEQNQVSGIMPLKTKSNERLEFLGDGIIEAITKFYLYKRFPLKDEGFMTETKISLVKNENLGRLVQKIGLQKWFIISKEAEEKGLRNNIKKLGCLFEAFVGALFLNFNKIQVDDEMINHVSKPLGVMSGYTICTQFIEAVFEKYINWNDILNENNNYKNIFQVMIQREFKVTPDYILLNGEYDEQTGITKPQNEYHTCVIVCCGNKSIHEQGFDINKIPIFNKVKCGFDYMKTMLEQHGGFIIRFGDSMHSTKKKAEQEACRLSIEMTK
jgi:ribonuclease-3